MTSAFALKREKLKAAELKFLKKHPLAYGGALRNTRAGRARPRPLATLNSMHLVLKASKAKGQWCFSRPAHAQKIKEIVKRFAAKYQIKIISFANAKNHLHLHVRLTRLHGYKPFIRAVTAAIAMAISGASRWNKVKESFWDYRPYTRLVTTKAGYLRLEDYIEVNKLEGLGYGRFNAAFQVARERDRKNGWPSG
jgi:REP element-mobilizing transposase RayT